jgi:hypothetical protein
VRFDEVVGGAGTFSDMELSDAIRFANCRWQDRQRRNGLRLFFDLPGGTRK